MNNPSRRGLAEAKPTPAQRRALAEIERKNVERGRPCLWPDGVAVLTMQLILLYGWVERVGETRLIYRYKITEKGAAMARGVDQ